MGLSLDGLVARPGRYGALSWGVPPEDPALKERKLGWMREVGRSNEDEVNPKEVR